MKKLLLLLPLFLFCVARPAKAQTKYYIGGCTGETASSAMVNCSPSPAIPAGQAANCACCALEPDSWAYPAKSPKPGIVPFVLECRRNGSASHGLGRSLWPCGNTLFGLHLSDWQFFCALLYQNGLEAYGRCFPPRLCRNGLPNDGGAH